MGCDFLAVTGSSTGPLEGGIVPLFRQSPRRRETPFPMTLPMLTTALLLAAPAVAQFAPSKSIAPDANEPVAMAIGDFDADGDLDVAVAARGEGRILLFDRVGPLASAGAFTEPQELVESVPDLTDLHAVDLDADGDLDLVSAAGSTVSWLSNDGTGQLSFGGDLAVLPGAISNISVVDHDLDGDLDIIAAGADLVLLDGLGSGSFATPVPLASTTLETDDLVVADLDGDGDLDLAAVGASQVIWLRNDGSVPFAGPVVLDQGVVDATDIDAVDLLGGGVDLVATVRSTGSIYRYPAMGGGAFGPRTILAGGAPEAVESEFGDFDGDGDLDMVVARGVGASLVWYTNTGAQSLTGPFLLTLTGIGAPISMVVTDLNADGRPDVVAGTVFRTVHAYTSLGASGSGIFFEGPFEVTQRAAGAADVSAVDVDGDGDLDALAALRTGMRLVWYENVDGELTDITHTIDEGARFSLVRAADLDGDGNVDLMAATITDGILRQYRGLGAGLFSAPIVVDTFATDGAQEFKFGDADSDGDLDLFVTRNPEYMLIHYVNDGMGNFGPRITIDGDPPGVMDIELGDFDDDGILDVALSQAIFTSIVLYRGLGAGAFAPGVSLENGAQMAFGDLEAADLDGDGDLDLVWQTSFNNQIAWMEKLGPGNFAPRQLLSDQVGSGIELEVFDVDLDGDLDLVTTSRGPDRIEWMSNDGSMTFSSPTLIESTEYFTVELRVADIDGDGDGDLLLAQLVEGRVALLENLTLDKVGEVACAGVANSTGQPAELCIMGSELLAVDQMTLTVTQLPPNSAGYFLASTDAAFVVGAGGSLGTLCLGGSIGRYVGPGQVQNSGASGTFSLELDLGMIPQPTSFVAAMAGETWRFQSWYRDSIGGQAVSNFTSASATTFQ